MYSKKRRLFFVALLALAIAVFYSVQNDVYAGKGTTGGGPSHGDDGSSGGKNHDDGSSDDNSGHKPEKKKPKKHWRTDGNANIDSDTHFLGTTDPADLVIKTNNTEKARVTIDGDVGIGTASPTGTLHVAGGTADLDTDGKDVTIEAQDGGPTTGLGGNIVLTPGIDGDGTSSGTVYVGEVDSLDPPILTLDVNGQIRIRGGSPFAGGVLTSDSDGIATWQSNNDADADPTNELQTLSQTGNSVTLSHGGGSVTVADNDNDSSNEFQTLTQTGNSVTLSNGGGLISVDDGDSDSTNEHQNLSSSAAGTNRTIDISSGIGTTIDVADNDDDPINEFQTLNFTDTNLSITDGNSVDLSSLSDTDWTDDGSNVYRLTGSVGIGTITPITLLHAFGATTGNIAVDRGDPAGGFASFDLFNNQNGGTGWSIQMQPNNNDLSFFDRAGGLTRVTIDQGTGNVGIGTASPNSKLDIAGNIALSGSGTTITTANTDLVLEQTGDAFGTTRLSMQNRLGSGGPLLENASLNLVDIGFKPMTGPQSNFRLERRPSFLVDAGNTSGEWQLIDDTLGTLVKTHAFGTSATIINSGNVGIGTTTPGAKLDIAGNIKIADGTQGAGEVLTSNASGLGTWEPIPNDGDWTISGNNMSSAVSGNVGIGTTTPVSTLDVAGGANAILHVAGSVSPTVTSQGAYIGWNALTGGTGETNFINNQGTGTGGFAFMNTPPSGAPLSTLMFINGSGNVGIGTTAPAQKLDVSGTVKATAYLGNGSGLTGVDTSTLNELNTAVALVGSTLQVTDAGGTKSADLSSLSDTDWTESGGNVTRSTGKVGIGTSTPDVNAKLDVAGNIRLGAADRKIFWDWPNRAILQADSNGASPGGNVIRFMNSMSGAGSNPQGGFEFTTDGTLQPLTVVMKITDGRVGIGTTSPLHPLHMGSGAHVTAGGVWTNASSREYKENIIELTYDNALSALNNLTPVTYNYKVDKEENYVGFIAEDVPELVAMKERNSLSSMDIVAVLTKVVKRQQEEIEQLKGTLTALTDRQSAIEDMLLASSTDLPKEKLASLIGEEKK